MIYGQLNTGATKDDYTSGVACRSQFGVKGCGGGGAYIQMYSKCVNGHDEHITEQDTRVY